MKVKTLNHYFKQFVLGELCECGQLLRVGTDFVCEQILSFKKLVLLIFV